MSNYQQTLWGFTYIHNSQPVDPSEALVFSGENKEEALRSAKLYAYRNDWQRPIFLCRVHHHGLKNQFHYEFFEAVRGDGTRVSTQDLLDNNVVVIDEWK